MQELFSLPSENIKQLKPKITNAYLMPSLNTTLSSYSIRFKSLENINSSYLLSEKQLYLEILKDSSVLAIFDLHYGHISSANTHLLHLLSRALPTLSMKQENKYTLSSHNKLQSFLPIFLYLSRYILLDKL